MSELSYKIEIDGIQKVITSVTEANKVIKQLTAEIIKAKEAGQDFTQTAIELNKAINIKQNIQNLSRGLTDMNRGMQQSQTASANASTALLNLNYVIRDSPYFFNNFALGVLAVGNNLNPLIDSFSRLRQEAGEKTISTFALLRQALVGGAGISIAFSLVVTAIQSYVFWMAKTENQTKKTKEETDLLTESLNKMVDVKSPFEKMAFQISPDKLPQVISVIENTIKSLEEADKKMGGQFFSGTGETRTKIDLSGIVEDTKNVSDANSKIKEYLEEQKLSLEAQQRIYDALVKAGLIMVSTEKEKTKQQKIRLRDLDLEFSKLYGKKYGGYEDKDTITRESRRLERERLNLIDFRFGNLPAGERDTSGMKTGVEYIAEDLKKVEEEMKMMSQVSNILGDALVSAFTKGKFSLQEFLNMLGLAIVKMVTLQAINYGMGLPSIFSKESMGKISSPNFKASSIQQKQVITGKISMNAREFYVQFKNAENVINSTRP